MKAERDKFTGLLNSLSDGLDIIDKNYRICFQNKMLIDRFGDLRGKLCFETYMNRQVPCEFCLIKEAMKTGKTQRVEITAPDGRIYELTSTPFKDTNGETKVIEFVRDITKSKKTDARIQESEKRFSELFDHMSSGVAVYESVANGKDFIIKDFNKAAEKIDNVKRKIILGRSVLEIFPGIKEFGLFDVLKRVWNTGKPELFPVKLYRDKRIKGWREHFVYKLPSGEIVTIYDDITKRKQTEEKIEESEERFRKSIMNAPLPVMIHKENGKVISINDAWTEITGYALDEIPTIAEWTKKAYGKKKNLIKDGIDKLYKIDKRIDEGEFKIKTKDGSKRTWHFSSAPLGKAPDGLRLVISMALDVTERKEREREYKNLINGMNDTAFVINFEGKFIDVNDRAVEVLGYSRKELLAIGPTDIDTTLKVEEIKNLIEGMKKGERQVFPTTHRTKSGKIIPVEVSSSLISYMGKTAILSIARDITDRKKAEDALRESEERFQAAIENLPYGVCLHDLDGRILLVNKATYKMIGYTQDEMLNMNVMDFDSGVKVREEREKLWPKLKKGSSARIESVHHHKDGYSFPVEINISAINLKGQPMILAIVHDITEQKEAQEKLKESEERFETVIENLPDEIFVHGLDGKFIMVNKASCEKTGYTKEELLNLEVSDIDHESINRDDRKNIWEKLQKKGGFERIESTHYRKDGSSYPAETYFGSVTFKGSPMIIGIAHDITERKKALGALRKSENQLSVIFNNASDPLLLLSVDNDGDFRLARVNKTAIDTANNLGLNVSTESFSKKTLREGLCDVIGLPEKVFDNAVKGIKETVKTGKSGFYEETYNFGKEIFYSEVTTVPIFDQEGNCVYVLLTPHDVTKTRRTLEKLKESEERFQMAIEHLPHAVCVHDLDGKFILVNEALCKHTGYSRDEFTKMTVANVDPHSQTREDRKKIWLNLKKGGHIRFESKLYRKDGSSYPVELYLNAVTLEGIPMILAIAQDISYRKQAVDNLQKSEQKYRNLYESMLDAFVRTDMKGNILEFNKQYLDMLGYTENEIKKLKYIDITPEKWHDMEEKILQEQILKKGSSEVYEKEYAKKDGTIFPVEIRRFLLTDNNNKPKGMWATVRDISERRKTEEELRKVERLESLGVLAGGIAHDFNNLLTGILGNLSLAQMGKGEDFEEILDEAKQASLQAKNLTQQLLTFSKGGEPIKGKVNIEKAIRKSAEFSLHGSNVRCVYHFVRDLWKAEVDKGQLAQVIENLVINAKQAMPEGGKIRIKAENISTEEQKSLTLLKGKYIKITFQDEGIGVPEEYLPKIFDPYFSTKQEGSGLGLASVYSIIQKHEGHITVESEPGKGTTFFIYLPAIEEKASKEEKEEGKKTKGTPWGEGKILIMDDEKIVRRAVGGMLGRLGYLVDFAENGEEAITKYKEAKKQGDPFHAVILDLTVPGGMGGKKTIEKLLQIDPSVKAIVSSGYSTDPIMANYEKHGFKAVVAKPFDLKELDNTIKKVLG